MTEIRVVVACATCHLHWSENETTSCQDPTHDHQRFEVHCHRSPVTLPDGTVVTAASFDSADPYAREQSPDYGVYLDGRWQPPWTHEHLDWPDFGVPDDRDRVVAALAGALERARAGQRVEIGCLGGHGRTGTALAVLAVLAGCPAGEAVAWVRAHYCSAAIETPGQEAFVGLGS